MPTNIFRWSPWWHNVEITGLYLEVSEFEHQWCNYIHFRTNTLGKSIELSYLPSYILDSITAVLLLG